MSVKQRMNYGYADQIIGEAMDENTAVYMRKDGTKSWWKANGTHDAEGVVGSQVTAADITAGGDRVRRTIYNDCILDGFTSLTPGSRIVVGATDGVLASERATQSTLQRDVGFAIDDKQVRFFVPPLRQAKRVKTDFSGPSLAAKSAGAGAATGTGGDVNVLLQWNLDGTVVAFQYTMHGTQTIVAPTQAAGGLDITMDATNADGIEFDHGIVACNPLIFTVGTDRCYVKLRVTIDDASGVNPLFVGFRKVAARATDYNDWTDFAVIGDYAGDIKIETALNNAATVTTDTTDNWADGATHTLEVYVSKTGVVTYKIDGAAPTTVAAFTFDSGDTIMPVFQNLQGSDVAASVVLSLYEAGAD